MTEDQEKLLPYVESRVERVIRDKESKRIFPLVATENEIVANVRGDVLECMRALHRQNKYTGTNTLNNPALIKKEK